MSPHPPPTVPSILLPELLGFSPQLLLDDVINVANNAVTETVGAMEIFMLRWAKERALTAAGKDWDSNQDIEQGLVAFQTLLESHIDIAFDFFELWSLRNIFAIPAHLPIVAPHHKGLDLQFEPERELELMTEIEELRRKIDNQRRLNRSYTRAVRISNMQLERSKYRLDRIIFLRSPQLQTLASLPEAFTTMYGYVSTLPPHDPASFQLPLPDPGKRPWETSKTGYLNWAVGQLLVRGGGASGKGSSAVGKAAESAYDVGKSEDVKAALEAAGEKDIVSRWEATRNERGQEGAMEL